jgi:hypothetical protein
MDDRYALGVCLSYPRQKPAPVLAEYWLDPRKILSLEHLEKMPEAPGDASPDPGSDLKASLLIQQQYNESWCAMTFLVDNEVGKKVFGLFIEAFRNGRNLSSIKSEYYNEQFLRSFETAWYQFIEKKVLNKWRLPTVGGKTLLVGDGSSPPAATEGYPLTDDKRGDLFLVRAEAGKVPKTAAGQEWWMLKAWGMPVRFYQEAWKEAPAVLKSGHPIVVGGGYALVAIPHPAAPAMRLFLLFPVWVQIRDEALSLRIIDAAGNLIGRERARENAAKTKAGEKPAAKPAPKPAPKG